MLNKVDFVEKEGHPMIKRSENSLTTIDNSSWVTHTSLLGEMRRGDEVIPIHLVDFVEKRPALPWYYGDSDATNSAFYNYGEESTQKELLVAKEKVRLFKSETDNILHLNKLSNPYVPKIIDAKENYYKMVFVHGISGEDTNNLDLNFDTRMAIMKQAMRGVSRVFNDGVVNLEYAPKNTIIIPDKNTGRPISIQLIDFGVSFRVDEMGDISVDAGVLNGILRIETEGGVAGLLPPELYRKQGMVKVNAEACLVWSLSHRVLRSWLRKADRIPGLRNIITRSEDDDPAKRCTLKELVDYVEGIRIKEVEIESCIPEEMLKKYRSMIGTPDSEVFVSEEQVARIADEMEKLKTLNEQNVLERRQHETSEREKRIRIAGILTDLANEFINSEDTEYNTYDVARQIEEDLKEESRILYQELKSKIDFTNESTILRSISALVKPKDPNKKIPEALKSFPKFYRSHPEYGMSHNLAALIMKFSMEEIHIDTYIYIAQNHLVAMSDNEITQTVKIYDPFMTDSGNTEPSFLIEFNKEQTSKRRAVTHNNSYKGTVVRIALDQKPQGTDLFNRPNAEKRGYYQDLLYVSGSKLVELSVYLHDFEDLIREGVISADVSLDEIISTTGMFDHRKAFEETE